MKKPRKTVESDILDQRWLYMLAELSRFQKQFGNCNVPQGWIGNKALANWVKWQRKMYILGKIIEWRKNLLNEIGFSWKLLEAPAIRLNWKKRYMQLIEFNKKYKHSDVPNEFKYIPGLGSWVGQQRQDYKSKKLTEDKIKLLEVVNFKWKINDVNIKPWQKRFEELEVFFHANGHCYVPRTPTYKNLQNWIKNQLRSRDKISAEKKAKLDSIQFDWQGRGSVQNRLHQFRLKDKFWEIKFNMLLKFKEKYGHTMVPNRYQQFPGLSSWVYSQRTLRRSGKVPKYRVKRLDAIDFQWRVSITEGKKNSKFIKSL